MATISWFVPSLIKGSGGHRTILIHAEALEKQGHECRIYIEGEGTDSSAAKRIRDLFGLSFSFVCYGWEKVTPCDLCVATIWYSAKFVRDISFDCKKLYFVQDFEAYFMPMGEGYLFAENSYKYKIPTITIGRWLTNKLRQEFNSESYYYDFGAVPDNNIPDFETREKAVCFIYQPDKPRRCAQLGIEALGILKAVSPDIKIYLYGTNSRPKLWFDFEFLGLLSVNQCRELYRKCSVGLCLSSSNPSRIPFEMMASGLPVVELFRENNLYDMPDDCVLLCDQTPEALAQGMLKLMREPNLLQEKSIACIEYMKNKTESTEIQQSTKIINKIIKGQSIDQATPEKTYKKIPREASENQNFLFKTNSSYGSSNMKKKGYLSRKWRQLKQYIKG